MYFYAFKVPNFAPNFFKNDAKYRIFQMKIKYLTIKKTKIKNPSKALFQAIKGFKRLEVPPRFELGNNSFADCGLTTWQWHLI